MPNDKLKSYLHLHFIVFIWGFTAILGALISIDALPLVMYRMVLAVVLIGIYMSVVKIPFSVTRKQLFKFFLAGFVIAFHWLAFFEAIKVSNVSVTLAALSTGAFFTSFIEPFVNKRKIKTYEVFLGLVVILALGMIFNVETKYQLGILYGLIAAFLSALFSVINSQLVKVHAPAIISFYELLGGSLLFILLVGILYPISLDTFQLQPKDFLYLFILSSVCTAYAFIASIAVMKHLTAFTVMLTINLEPIYGIIMAVLLFKEKEKMSSSFYFGAIIILLTVMANGWLKIRRNKKLRLNKIENPVE